MIFNFKSHSHISVFLTMFFHLFCHCKSFSWQQIQIPLGEVTHTVDVPSISTLLIQLLKYFPQTTFPVFVIKTRLNISSANTLALSLSFPLCCNTAPSHTPSTFSLILVELGHILWRKCCR